MAVAKPLSSMPFPLGKVAPVANTPLQVSSNFTDLAAEPVNSLWIQALSTNTGLVYILCQQTAVAKDTTNYTNIAFTLSAGQGVPINGKYGNQVKLGYIWIDVDNSGEGAFATIQQE